MVALTPLGTDAIVVGDRIFHNLDDLIILAGGTTINARGSVFFKLQKNTVAAGVAYSVPTNTTFNVEAVEIEWFTSTTIAVEGPSLLYALTNLGFDISSGLTGTGIFSGQGQTSAGSLPPMDAPISMNFVAADKGNFQGLALWGSIAQLNFPHAMGSHVVGLGPYNIRLYGFENT